MSRHDHHSTAERLFGALAIGCAIYTLYWLSEALSLAARLGVECD